MPHISQATIGLLVLSLTPMALAPIAAVAATPGAILKSVDFDGKAPVQVVEGDLKVTIEAVKDATTGDPAPHAKGEFRGKPAFDITFDGASEATAKLLIVPLAGQIPQVVFQHFTFGAHCCTESKIASTPTGETWTIIDGDSLDGDAGYTFQDIDGDGDLELVSQDNSFLYAYASYAESLAPVRVQRFDGMRLVDVTGDPPFRHAVEDDLAGIEKSANDDATLWHSNGFLAAWVADKIRLGTGAVAWERMLKDYNRQPDTPPQVCTLDVPLAQCPDGKSKDASFPVALRTDLVAGGYIKSAADYPIPPADTKAPESPK